MNNWIYSFENIFNKEVCETLKTLVDKNAVTLNESYRKCKQYFIPVENEIIPIVKERLKLAVDEYKSMVPDNNHLAFASQMEQPSVLRYDVNAEDHFHLHSDNWNSASACRQLSVVAYLSDCEEGGETIFPNQEIILKPKQGTVVLFPAFYTHPHLATSPVSEAKYCLVTWLCYAITGAPYWTINL